MDVFARLMDGVRARGALFGRAVLEPPQSPRAPRGLSSPWPTGRRAGRGS
ncbi:hypothetical protein [Nonomuraea sp. CA-141351]